MNGSLASYRAWTSRWTISDRQCDRATVPARSCALIPTFTGASKRSARADGATLFHTLLAAFEVLMFRLSGQNDLIVGITDRGAVGTRERSSRCALRYNVAVALPGRSECDLFAISEGAARNLPRGPRASKCHVRQLVVQAEDTARCQPPSADLGRIQHRQDGSGLRFWRSFPQARGDSEALRDVRSQRQRYRTLDTICLSNATTTAISWKRTRFGVGWSICRRCLARLCVMQSSRLPGSIFWAVRSPMSGADARDVRRCTVAFAFRGSGTGRRRIRKRWRRARSG